MPKEDGRDYEEVHIQGWPNVDDYSVRRYKNSAKKKEDEAELDRKAQQHQEDEFYDEFSPKSSDFI